MAVESKTDPYRPHVNTLEIPFTTMESICTRNANIISKFDQNESLEKKTKTKIQNPSY